MSMRQKYITLNILIAVILASIFVVIAKGLHVSWVIGLIFTYNGCQLVYFKLKMKELAEEKTELLNNLTKIVYNTDLDNEYL